MENIKKIYIKNFSITPGPRYRDEGEFSGQQFREDVLDKFFSEQEKDSRIEIILDGTLGYGTSFLEEVFGGLARKYGSAQVKEKIIKIISEEEPYLIEDIEGYINETEQE